MIYTCPVCGFNKLEDPPANDEICPSCGTQFGYHDFTRSHAELRVRWLANGALWHSRVDPQPPNWNGIRQLFDTGLVYSATTPNADSQISVVDLGVRERVISNSGLFTSKVKERLIALGNSVPHVFAHVKSATASAGR
jgi:rubredoxin